MHTTYPNPLPLEESEHAGTLTSLERWGITAAAATVIGYGLSRRSIPGVCLAIAATPVIYRGVVGRWPPYVSDLIGTYAADTRVALSGDRGIHVRESVRLEKPIADVYRFWRQFEHLPQFMTNLVRVDDLGGGRSHWVAKSPAGGTVEWDAEIINEVENKVIGWRSLPDADVITAGSVNFDAVRSGRSTQVSVHLQYAAPGGQLGAWAATIVGREPSHMIREDLRRLKQLLEAGEIPRSTPDDASRRSL